MAQGLAAEQVKILRGVGRLRNLNIVFRGELQEALDTGAGVFRSLAFVAMGQKQDDAREQAPLALNHAAKWQMERVILRRSPKLTPPYSPKLTQPF